MLEEPERGLFSFHPAGNVEARCNFELCKKRGQRAVRANPCLVLSDLVWLWLGGTCTGGLGRDGTAMAQKLVAEKQMG
jgi:hypothetical protein